MVRHTDDLRRTSKDLEYLDDVAKDDRAFFVVDTDKATDADRNSRLRAHGWLSSNGKYTADGKRIAEVVDRLRTAREFDWAVGIFTVGEFVDISTRSNPNDVVDMFRKVHSIANLCDEARHQAGTQDAEPDHDGLFAPHIDEVDTHRKTVDVVFDAVSTADAFADLWNRGHGESVAVQSAADPNRVSVGSA